MKNNLPQKVSEFLFDRHLIIGDNFNEDSLEHLQGIREDLGYISTALEQTEIRFGKVIRENRKLKAFLRRMVQECWCLPGNRCFQCQEILATLGYFAPGQISSQVRLEIEIESDGENMGDR